MRNKKFLNTVELFQYSLSRHRWPDNARRFAPRELRFIENFWNMLDDYQRTRKAALKIRDIVLSTYPDARSDSYYDGARELLQSIVDSLPRKIADRNGFPDFEHSIESFEATDRSGQKTKMQKVIITAKNFELQISTFYPRRRHTLRNDASHVTFITNDVLKLLVTGKNKDTAGFLSAASFIPTPKGYFSPANKDGIALAKASSAIADGILEAAGQKTPLFDAAIEKPTILPGSLESFLKSNRRGIAKRPEIKSMRRYAVGRKIKRMSYSSLLRFNSITSYTNRLSYNVNNNKWLRENFRKEIWRDIGFFIGDLYRWFKPRWIAKAAIRDAARARSSLRHFRTKQQPDIDLLDKYAEELTAWGQSHDVRIARSRIIHSEIKEYTRRLEEARFSLIPLACGSALGEKEKKEIMKILSAPAPSPGSPAAFPRILMPQEFNLPDLDGPDYGQLLEDTVAEIKKEKKAKFYHIEEKISFWYSVASVVRDKLSEEYALLEEIADKEEDLVEDYINYLSGINDFMMQVSHSILEEEQTLTSQIKELIKKEKILSAVARLITRHSCNPGSNKLEDVGLSLSKEFQNGKPDEKNAKKICEPSAGTGSGPVPPEF